MSKKNISIIDRSIPAPKELEKLVTSVVRFVANIKDAKTGKPLFSKETWKVFRGFLKHIRKGCVSDHPGIQYYYFTTKTNGRKVLHCIRGTSQLEGFHRHLRDIMKASYTAPLLAVCLMAVFVHRWNHDRAVDRQLCPEKYRGFHAHEILHDIASMEEFHDGDAGVFGDIKNPTDYKDTMETFYTPTVNKVLELSVPGDIGGQVFSKQVAYHAAESIRSGTEFLAQRLQDEIGIPITRFTNDDKKIFEEILANAAIPYNYAAMTAAHGERAELESIKPVDRRKQIFSKTAQMYKEHQKSYTNLSTCHGRKFKWIVSSDNS